MKLAKKEPIPDGRILVTVTGDWNDGDYITETGSYLLRHMERLLQRIVILQDFFNSREELMWTQEVMVSLFLR